MDGRESGECSPGAITGDDTPDGDEETYRDRYRALFENGQLFLWEFDLSTAARRAAELAEGTDDLVGYLDDNPDDHQWILEGMEVLDVNETAVEVYEADSKAELVSNLDRVMTEDSLEKLKGLWAALAARETNYRVSCRARTLAGSRRDIVFETCVPESHADDYARVYMAGLDVTERRERERELKRQNEYLDRFANVVSHDVATPLGVIENKARLVEITGDTSHAADIYDATEQVQTLVDDLLELARQGKRIGETEPVDLGTITKAAWHSVDSRAATLTVESTGDVVASRERLRQLLENLLENAVTHGTDESGGGTDAAGTADPDGERVEADGAGGADSSVPPVAEVIEKAHEHGTADPNDGRTDGEEGVGDGPVSVQVGTLDDGFYVADDGPGIPPGERSDVFEEGYTTSPTGTGLGLTIVERVAEAHGWSVTATESGDGGARFEVTDATVHSGT